MKPLPLPLLALLALPLAASADPGADAKLFDEQVRPFLARHCVECHGKEKPKGDFGVETLTANFADSGTRERWLTVLKRIESGEMPPKAKPRPPQDTAKALTDWIAAQV